MSECAICQKPVVKDPLVLRDGRLVHAACVPKDAAARAEERQPSSGIRPRVEVPKTKAR
jgi:hypothetical protein